MIAFWVLAIVLIASAVFTVMASKPVYSVVGLLSNFIALAILYLTLQAEFLAVMQIVVYSGAILVLFVFVIALLSSGVAPFSVGPNRLPRMLGPALLLVLVAFGLFTYGALHAAATAVPPPATVAAMAPTGTANAFGSIADFGAALFTTHLLPFEITSLILLVAIVGVVLLAGDAGSSGRRYVPTEKRRATARRESIVKGKL